MTYSPRPPEEVPAVDHIAAAIAKLESERDWHRGEVRRLEEAIAAMKNVAQHLSSLDSYNGQALPPERSVRQMMQDLLDEEDRDWSAREILAKYQERGTPIHGRDPENALRSAIADANKGLSIVRTETGRYKSAKFFKAPGVDPTPFRIAEDRFARKGAAS